jgi:hypothetical protein
MRDADNEINSPGLERPDRPLGSDLVITVILEVITLVATVSRRE